MRLLLPIVFLACAGLLLCGAARASSANDYGGIGLLQVPSARFSPDGQFTTGFSSVLPYNQLFATVQILPWLETTLRYAEVSNREFGPESSQSYKDRSVDFKLKLLSQSRYLPALALGFRDLGGTGLFAGEYLVASRSWGPLDATLGLGWGRLGARGDFGNPLSGFSDSFDTRQREGSTFRISKVFHGKDTALFGGLEWRTPLPGLSLKLEYEGNDYQSEALANNLPVATPFNAAINYRLGSLDLSAGYERGNTAMLRVALVTNFQRYFGMAKLLDPLPSLPGLNPTLAEPARAATAEDGYADFRQALAAELSRQQMTLSALDFDAPAGELHVRFRQTLTLNEARALGRVAQSLNVLAPEEFQVFSITQVVRGLETYRVRIQRRDVDNAVNYRDEPEAVWDSAELAPAAARPRSVAYFDLESYPETDWQVSPALRQSVGGPDRFYFAQLWLRLAGSVAVNEHWSFSGAAGVNIYNNFEELQARDTSRLPPVRSDIVRYLKEGQNNLVRLETNYIWSLAPQWHARLSAGIFEEMYGGVGAEVLYRPFDAGWALGANLNRVRQRTFEQLLEFQRYEVTTGHLNAYLPLPFYNTLAKISVGQYLAGDRGVTLDLSRRFRNGVRVGAFATRTNVSAADFGDGSFDKGFYLYLPFDLFLPRSSREGANLVFRPLTRDGGQKVRDGVDLYSLVAEQHRQAILEDSGQWYR
jgi:hypothetical protein